MPSPAVTKLEIARSAKDEARRKLAKVKEIVGVGLTRRGTGYAVKVNLEAAVDTAKLPHAMNGVPLVFEVVGRVRKR